MREKRVWFFGFLFFDGAAAVAAGARAPFLRLVFFLSLKRALCFSPCFSSKLLQPPDLPTV
jgi:hypothetical protein